MHSIDEGISGQQCHYASDEQWQMGGICKQMEMEMEMEAHLGQRQGGHAEREPQAQRDSPHRRAPRRHCSLPLAPGSSSSSVTGCR